MHTNTNMHGQERDLARKLARLKAQDAMEREAHEDLAAYLREKHEVGEGVLLDLVLNAVQPALTNVRQNKHTYIHHPVQETAAQVAAWREASTRELGELDAALARLTEVRG